MKYLKEILKRIFNKIIRFKNNKSIDLISSPASSINYFEDVDIQRGCIISADSFVGSYTYIGINTTITRTTIGRYCSIANNVSIGDGEHLLDRISTSSYFYDNAYETLTQHECIIGNDVWIGTKSIIRRGIKIGDGAVIGANSFVNKDVPNFAIVVGSPAKIIKYRFNDESISIIINSNWWNSSIEEARLMISELQIKLDEISTTQNP